MNPECPTCHDTVNTPSLDVFVKHEPGSRYCFNCEKDFVQPATQSLFYIQDTRQVVGNSASWWRVDGNGYTCNLDEAWKVPGTWKGRETDVLRACAEVDAMSERHFDVQKLKKS